MKTIQLKVNGAVHSISCPPAKSLLDVLREDLGLTASKECCGKGECGSCTVLINDEAACSCIVLAGQADGQEIITCEGVGLNPNLDAIQESFIEEGATQCGYCTPGIIVSAKAFLNGIDHIPAVDEIKTALGGNLCRCTGYTKIIKAVQTAASRNSSEKEPVKG
ncbi:(2Fe-2S)-binding protein [Cytobacillus sp. NCCP-133]|uniref:(2Fe-2S)-binding protein n=1 Tax=Cytobacillus sp. NCCP-133 TaxID=766848 RepID=UPI0022302B88|nr:(2Fe-2S)-binding protein [Cytobacillus sp. NCCP-133]GLB61331.1 (2Fe-2S)-binding protein [Cytobacillus sp. NCCP-133]